MDLSFDLGDPDRPRGHAIIYFRDSSNPDEVAATYVIVLPVTVDIAKYVPPFLAGQIPNLGEDGLGTFAFPPAPEPAGTMDEVIGMAEVRHDDLIFGGTHALTDVASLMGIVAEIVEEYAGRYEALSGVSLTSGDADDASLGDGTDEVSDSSEVDDVVYGLMSEADRLTELTRLVGRLRFAIEGADHGTSEDAAAHIRALGKHMPANRQIDRLLGAATSSESNGSKLAQLFLERAYCLMREDYLRVKSIDDEIRATETAA